MKELIGFNLVALTLTTISEATKKKADEWLEANNFAKGIWR